MSGQEVVVAPPKNERIPVTFDRNDPRAMYLDTGVFEQLNRVAVALSQSALVPEIFRGKPADCLLMTGQAMRWNIDPLVCAQHAYVTPHGKLGYEGKLIAAVINAELLARGEEPLEYEYTTIGDDRKITVSATIGGKVRSIEGFVSKWITKNDNWKKDPDQMLAYRGARQWARRYMPHILLGVASAEGEDERDVVEAADNARIVNVTQVLDGTGTPAAEPEKPKRTRRSREQIEADEKAAAEQAERERLEREGQQRLNIDGEAKVLDGEVVKDDPPADDPPADDPPADDEDASPEGLLKAAIADKKVSQAQADWMQKRLTGLSDLTSAKAIELMHGQMLKQLEAHPVLKAVWEAARKIAAAKFK